MFTRFKTTVIVQQFKQNANWSFIWIIQDAGKVVKQVIEDFIPRETAK
jgi:hypothetical protein